MKTFHAAISYILMKGQKGVILHAVGQPIDPENKTATKQRSRRSLNWEIL